jgi:hypothetical protein
VLGRPAISVEVQRSFWAWIRRGETIEVAAAAVGVSQTVGWRWFRKAGGVMPPQWSEHVGRPARLSFAERERIACRRAAGDGVRVIARAIGRLPSTISRELTRGIRRPKPVTGRPWLRLLPTSVLVVPRSRCFAVIPGYALMLSNICLSNIVPSRSVGD